MNSPPASEKAITKIQSAVIVITLIVAALVDLAFFLNTPPSPATPSLSLPSENLGWIVQVDGLVRHHLNLSVEEMTMMPKSTVNAELFCLPSPSATSGYLADSGN
jgi:hypothetical protein